MQEIRMMVKEKSEDDKGSDTLPDEVLLGKLERVESQLQEMNEKVLYLERHATVRPSPPPMFSTTTLKVERKKQPERHTGIPTSAPQKPKAQPLAKKKSKRQSATPAPTSYGSGPPPTPPVRPTMTFYQFINCRVRVLRQVYRVFRCNEGPQIPPLPSFLLPSLPGETDPER